MRDHCITWDTGQKYSSEAQRSWSWEDFPPVRGEENLYLFEGGIWVLETRVLCQGYWDYWDDISCKQITVDEAKQWLRHRRQVSPWQDWPEDLAKLLKPQRHRASSPGIKNLDQIDLLILDILWDAKGFAPLQEQIAQRCVFHKTPITDRTVRIRLNKLRKLGLTTPGENGRGELITSDGLERIQGPSHLQGHESDCRAKFLPDFR